MKRISVLMMCLVTVTLVSQYADLFYSGVNPTTQTIRILTDAPTDAQILSFDGNEIIASPTISYLDGYQIGTIIIPNHPYIGFRSNLQSNLINPVFTDQSTLPALNSMTKTADDPQGDHNFSLNHLDITATYATFSDDKLFFAIRNAGGGFPVSSGLNTFSYMTVIVDPTADPESNPIVWGLMHTVNLPGIISPGLYKITGSGTGDLERIGDIASTIDNASNTLIVSCDLSDLTSDTDFMAWFNPLYPKIATQAITSRINLITGNQEADSADAAELVLLPQMLSFSNDHEPVLSVPFVEMIGINLFEFRVDYSDGDQHLPWTAELIVNERDIYPLIPDDAYFDGAVQFRSPNLMLPPNWQNATFRFSDDDLLFVEETITNPFVAIDEQVYPAFTWSVSPNPASSYAEIQLTGIKGNTHDKPVTLTLHNLRGQVLKRLQIAPHNDRTSLSLDLSSYPAGLYFLRLSQDAHNQVKRLVKF